MPAASMASAGAAPPGCGTLEECAQQLMGYTHGILVQTYGDIEDGFDFEAMMEIEMEHKAHFAEMQEALHEAGVPVLALGAGCCTQCAKCTLVDSVHRWPYCSQRSAGVSRRTV